MTSQAKSLHLPFTQSPALGSNSLRESSSNLWLSLPFPVRVMSSGGWDGGGAEAVVSFWEAGETNVLEVNFLVASLSQIV